MVSVWSKPNGLPMATTGSPTCRLAESPSVAVGRFAPSILMTATSKPVSRADDLAREMAAVDHADGDALRAGDDVRVGQNQAAGVVDDARAEALVGAHADHGRADLLGDRRHRADGAVVALNWSRQPGCSLRSPVAAGRAPGPASRQR